MRHIFKAGFHTYLLYGIVHTSKHPTDASIQAQWLNYRHLEEQDTALAIKSVLKSGSKKMLRIFIMKDSAMSATIIGTAFLHFCAKNIDNIKKKVHIKIV